MDRTEIREFWFEGAGTRLFAVENGDGAPKGPASPDRSAPPDGGAEVRSIILAHGGLATHVSCRLFAAPLSPRYRVITPDLRASGRSVFAGQLSWAQLADDVAALARHLGLERAVIGGISFGAGVAIATALRHPKLVAGLALLHPGYGGADVGLSPAQQAAMDAMHAAGRRAPVEGVGVLLPLFDALPVAVRARAHKLVATYDTASVATSTAFMASGEQPFARASQLAAVQAPTVVVPGVDPQHPAEVAAIYARHLPRCRVVETSAFAGVIEELASALH